jgi:hypothetical protein
MQRRLFPRDALENALGQLLGFTIERRLAEQPTNLGVVTMLVAVLVAVLVIVAACSSLAPLAGRGRRPEAGG